jgi:2-dehydropantoate 2-reductase
MKICIVGGGGAIGGYLAVMLAKAGNEVTVVARGKTLDIIKRDGLTLIPEGGDKALVAKVKAVEKITDAGIPDVIMWLLRRTKWSLLLKILQKSWGPTPF